MTKIEITLDLGDAQGLAAILDAQANLGLEYVKSGRISAMRHALSAAMKSGISGVWNYGDGNLTFSLYHIGNKVGAIKCLREAEYMGLKEAKDILDYAKPLTDGRTELVITGATQEFFDKLHAACNYHQSTYRNNSVYVNLPVEKPQ